MMSRAANVKQMVLFTEVNGISDKTDGKDGIFI
jgi:hypothetical protein